MNYLVNEDRRRILYEWVENDNIRSCKAVIVKESIVVGKHYHKKKDEIFFLLKGKIIEGKVGDMLISNVSAPYKLIVKRGTYHEFLFEKDSILLGAATEMFDINDEISGTT